MEVQEILERPESNVPIGQRIEPKGNRGLISTNNYNSFLIRLKRRALSAASFHINIQFQSKKKGTMES
jgi:hypothetical protein